VYPSGNQSWVLTYYWRGKQRWWNFSSTEEMSLRQARQFATAALRDKANGMDPREPYKGSEKVKVLFKRWLVKRDLKPRTQNEYERSFSRYVQPVIGNLSMKDVHTRMAGRLFDRITEENGKVIANRVRSMLHSMWEHYIKRQYLPPARINPWYPIEPHKEKARERILTPEELTRLGDLMADPQTFDDYRDGEPILFILSTGLRKGEVENLKWSETDIGEEDVVLNLRDTKTGARTVPLGTEASQIIIRRFKAKRHYTSPYVFSNKHGNKLRLQRIWERLRKKADLEDVRLHDLRHTFASYAAGENQSLAMVSQLLGHKHAHTSSRYIHAYHDPVVRAANQTSAAITRHLWK
jgi:integrase